MADENARLRKINAEMLAALQYTSPILQDGLPETVNFDWTKEAIAKVENAIAEAERDLSRISIVILFSHTQPIGTPAHTGLGPKPVQGFLEGVSAVGACDDCGTGLRTGGVAGCTGGSAFL